MEIKCSVEELKLLFKNFEKNNNKELAPKESTSSDKCANPYTNS